MLKRNRDTTGFRSSFPILSAGYARVKGSAVNPSLVQGALAPPNYWRPPARTLIFSVRTSATNDNFPRFIYDPTGRFIYASLKNFSAIRLGLPPPFHARTREDSFMVVFYGSKNF